MQCREGETAAVPGRLLHGGGKAAQRALDGCGRRQTAGDWTVRQTVCIAGLQICCNATQTVMRWVAVPCKLRRRHAWRQLEGRLSQHAWLVYSLPLINSCSACRPSQPPLSPAPQRLRQLPDPHFPAATPAPARRSRGAMNAGSLTRSILQPPQRLWRVYTKHLDRSPRATKSFTSVVAAILGDALAQYISNIDKKGRWE